MKCPRGHEHVCKATGRSHYQHYCEVCQMSYEEGVMLELLVRASQDGLRVNRLECISDLHAQIQEDFLDYNYCPYCGEELEVEDEE